MAEQDPMIDRLRALDPAAGREPDLRALRARVEALRESAGTAPGEPETHEAGTDATGIAGPGAAEPDAAGAPRPGDPATSEPTVPLDPTAPSDSPAPLDLAAARERRQGAERTRRRRAVPGWLSSAAVVLAAVVVGVLIGRSDGGMVFDAGDDSAAETMSEADAAEDSQMDSYGLPAPEMAGEGAESSGTSGESGGRVFVDGGLSSQPSTGTVWGYDAERAELSPARVAQVFGDAGEADVELGETGAAEVSFVDPQLETLAAGLDRPDPLIVGVPGGLDGTDLTVGPGDGGEAPVRAVLDVIDALGLPTSDLRVEVGRSSTGASQAAWVWVFAEEPVAVAHPVWSAIVIEDRVLSFSGPVAPLVDLGEYDVVSPAEALQRLSDPRFGHLVIGGSSAAADGAPAQDGDDQALPEPGEPIRVPVDEVVVDEAELVYRMEVTGAGQAFLAPYYHLRAADGTVWVVLALSETDLDLAPRP